MNAREGKLMYDYTKLDEALQMGHTPKELAMEFNRMQAGLADILAQVVSYLHSVGEYEFYVREETTGGIYQLLDFFEVLADLKETD